MQNESFKNITLSQPLKNVVFRKCTFDNVKITGTLHSVDFIGCRFMHISFKKCKNVVFKHCECTYMTIPESSNYLEFHKCTLYKNAMFSKRMAHFLFENCKVLENSFKQSALKHVMIRACSFKRNVFDFTSWQTVHIQDSTFTNDSFHKTTWSFTTERNNTWKKCTRMLSTFGGGTSNNVHFIRCRDQHVCCNNQKYVKCLWDQGDHTHNRWHHVRCLQSTIKNCAFSHSIHHEGTFIDCKRLHVQWDESTCEKTKWINPHDQELDTTNTVFKNCQREMVASLKGEIVQVDETENTKYVCTFYSKHHALYTHDGDRCFRVRQSSALEIDFISVVPKKTWMATLFPYSVHPHKNIKYIIIGTKIYVPSNETYRDEKKGIDIPCGYRFVQLKRKHSFP